LKATKSLLSELGVELEAEDLTKDYDSIVNIALDKWKEANKPKVDTDSAKLMEEWQAKFKASQTTIKQLEKEKEEVIASAQSKIENEISNFFTNEQILKLSMKEDKEFVSQKTDFGKILKSDAVIILVTALVVAFTAKTAIDGLYAVGVQQGYAPAQPIAFSHALHAGQYEIACQYCHTGVEIGKSANIPSANICMNCHTHIQNVGGKEGVSPEIQKIYNAVDNNQPIEWVRVHNLPDLAYFNHAQHVAVGGVECQTCHGPIQEMEVVGQHSTLTMGWCIDCHRQTEIATEGNVYYDKLVQLHSTSKDALKVKDIGGLECAKCHY
jgi:glutaredoxin